MKVVIDTNVLVSGLLNPHGNPGRVVDLVTSQQLTPLYDDRVMAEWTEVLSRPKFDFDSEDVETLLDFLETQGEHVVAAPLPIEIRDPDDLPFLEVAVAGRASILVTGNARGFEPVVGNHEVLVMSPTEFIENWLGRQRQ